MPGKAFLFASWICIVGGLRRMQPDAPVAAYRSPVVSRRLRKLAPSACMTLPEGSEKRKLREEDTNVETFTTEVEDSLIIHAPRSVLYEAYNDIERMPEWLPMLRSVKVTDRKRKRSQWDLKVPRVVKPFARAAGFEDALRWNATHDGDAPRRIWWRSLTGIPKEGLSVFEPVDGKENETRLTASVAWTLPTVAKPLVQNRVVMYFLRKTLRITMKQFRDKMEEEQRAKRKNR